MKGLSPRTQEHYLGSVCGLARHWGRAPQALSADEVRSWVMGRIGRGLSPRTINADISALRLFFADAMGQPDMPIPTLSGITNIIVRHHHESGSAEWMLPKNMDAEDFLNHLVHRGALYIDDDNDRVYSPIPSFRSYLIEVGAEPESSESTPENAQDDDKDMVSIRWRRNGHFRRRLASILPKAGDARNRFVSHDACCATVLTGIRAAPHAPNSSNISLRGSVPSLRPIHQQSAKKQNEDNRNRPVTGHGVECGGQCG